MFSNFVPMSFTQKLGGLFGGKKQTNAPLPPTPNGNTNLISPQLMQYRKDEDEISNFINQYSEKMNQETAFLQSAEQMARAHTDPASILKAQEEIEQSRHRLNQWTNELYKFLVHMQELSQIRRKAELDILRGIMVPNEPFPKNIVEIQDIEGRIKVAISQYQTNLMNETTSRENAIRVLNSNQAPDRNLVIKDIQIYEARIYQLNSDLIKCLTDYKIISLQLTEAEIRWTIEFIERATQRPITSFGYIPHVPGQGLQVQQSQQQFQQSPQQFQQTPQQFQQSPQQFQQATLGAQASPPVASNPQFQESPIPGNTLPRNAAQQPMTTPSPAQMAQQAFGQPATAAQTAVPQENALSIEIEPLKDFPNGIPKEEYARIVSERNKYGEMCQFLAGDMLKNGVDAMYITVANQLTDEREKSRAAESQVATLRNQVATLKDEIERLKKTPTAAPIPAPVVLQAKDSEEWKEKWQNQLESKIAFLQVRLQNPPSADSKSLMEKEMWINQEMLDSLKVQIEKDIVKLTKQDYERLKKEVVESKEDVAILEEEAAKFTEIQENLESQIQQQKSEISKLKEEMQNVAPAENQPAVAPGSLEDYQLKEKELQAQVDTLVNENSILHKQKLDLEAKITTLETSSTVVPTSPTISSKELISTNLLESEIRKLNLKVSALSSDLAAASGWESTASKLTEDVDKLTNERNEIQSQLFVVKAQYKQASKKVETLSESVRELQTSLAHYKSESERLKEELEIALNQPPSNVPEFDTLLAERDQLASSLNETKIALAGLQSKYQIELANVASLKKTLQELTE
ncbi:hypothetical protein HK103_000018 [Boothiomyces macroporosus]|uniref:Uncharacterized protein n=1 Tax=Boothiomyces macroporosus TaxID=261099 RepID=A0AAD5UMS0_9FUNG|nr:hypothetical protein HK103_000018 [Boothiomyces macroporosus]